MESIENDNSKQSYYINSLIKSFGVLEILSEYDEMSILELSKASGLGKSSIHRILGTFKHIGYVNQNNINGKYYATIKLFELGNKVANRMPLRKVARPFLEELFEVCHETVNIGILDKQEVVYLDKIITKEPLRIELDIGRRVPAFCSAMGKAILAFNDSVSISELQLRKITDTTIDTYEELENQLKQIRNQGYAIDNEEYIKGLTCISVPLKVDDNMSYVALSIASPSARITEEKKQIYIQLLRNTADKITNALGSWGKHCI